MAEHEIDNPESISSWHTQSSSDSRRRARSLSSIMGDIPGSVDELLPLMVTILHAVAEAQQRDGRPSNLDPRQISLRDDGNIGIQHQSQFATGKTFRLSSLKYMSPELLQNELPVNSAAADSYTLGFVFYELLLGRRLFDEQFQQVRQNGDAGWLIWHADRFSGALPAQQLLPDIPSFISDTLAQMMAKDPKERITDLESIARIFGRASDSTAIYRVLQDLPPDGGRPLPSSISIAMQHCGPRPWLVRLAKQRLWKLLWKRVTPDDPRPGWQSVQELDRMLHSVETAFKRLVWMIPFPDRGQRIRGYRNS